MAETYILRNPDRDTWRRFKLLAAQQETPMRTIILRLIADYVATTDKPSKRKAA